MNKIPLFGNKKFYKNALAIALPVMLQQFITALVSLVDNFMVSALGDEMMASVNVANQFNFLFIVLLNTIMIAGGVYLAQYKGAQDSWGMRQAYRFKILFAIFIGIIYWAILFFNPAPLLKVMTQGNDAQNILISYGTDYMKIIAFTALFMPFSFAIGTSYRETGKPTIPLVISVVATCINTFLNWIFIYGNLGAPRLEVEGAALATVIARAIEALLFLLYARFYKAEFFVGVKRILKINIQMFVEILRKSTLVFFSEITWVGSELFITALYNSRGGAENVAGMAAGFAIANIFYLVFSGVHTATAVLVGNRLGAGHLQEAQSRAKWLMSGSVIAGIVIGMFMYVSSFSIPYIYGNLTIDAHHITRNLLYVVAFFMPLWALLNAQFAVARSGGDTVFGVIVDVPVSVLLFAPIAIVLTKYTNTSAPLIFGLSKLTDFAKLAFAVHFLSKKRWVKKLTKDSHEEELL